MEDEQEISTEDVKKQFDEISNKVEAETSEESSTPEKKASAPTPEVEKSVTEEVEEAEPKVIPYSRFKEVNDKVKEFERLEQEVGGLVERGPDGKLRIKVQEKEKEPEDDVLKLTEEEQLALDSVQTSVVSKLVQREFSQRERQAENTRVYIEQSSNWWNKAQEEFPQVKDKSSDMYKRADKIFREQYVTDLGKGKWTAPPNAHYLSCLQAEKELSRDKVKKEQAIIQEKKTQKQTVFVSKKSDVAPEKGKVKPKDLDDMSHDQQEQALRDEWNEIHKDEE